MADQPAQLAKFSTCLLDWAGGHEAVEVVGDPKLLDSQKIALFCSIRCPGDLILAAYDYAKKLRDAGTAVISGFHSPVEKECLRILLRGTQPIIICPARSLAKMRIASELRPHIEKGRLVLLSPFSEKEHRATSESARERNGFVARLADKLCFIYAEPGGSLQALADEMKLMGKTFVSCR